LRGLFAFVTLVETILISVSAIMVKAADSKRVLVTIPIDVREWLEERAKYNGSTISAEVVRSIRGRMERERAIGKDRTRVTAPERRP
jgi:hypothetical protein